MICDKSTSYQNQTKQKKPLENSTKNPIKIWNTHPIYGFKQLSIFIKLTIILGY